MTSIFHATRLAALCAITASATGALAQDAPDCDGLDRPVAFAGLDWNSPAFNNEVASFIVDHGYGCETDIVPGTTIPLLNGLARGDVDIMMETWIPNLQDAWDEAAAGGDVAIVGTNYEGVQHWYVPRYLVDGEDAAAPDLTSVTDLARYKALFPDASEPGKGRFYNCIIGWGCEVMNTKKLIAYGLDDDFTNVRPGTGGALSAAIESHMLREKPIVFYYWEPTWVMGKFGPDLVALEEPAYSEATWSELSEMPEQDVTSDTAATAYPSVTVSITVNTEFRDQAPSIIKFLNAYQLDADVISESLAYMRESGASAEEAAIRWLSGNPDVWRAWVPAPVAEGVSQALNGA